jgi:putative transposase
MGRSIQFESRHVELWGIYEMERDDDVLEFYDQPTRIQLQYRARSGRKTTQWHTPDFFVIRQSSAGFEEWKPVTTLDTLKMTMPERYQHELSGGWRCPPGINAAQAHGLFYRIRTNAQVHPLVVQNLKFLQDFWIHVYEVPPEQEAQVLRLLTTAPGITVRQLTSACDSLPVDVLWAMLTDHRLFTDLSASSLMQWDLVRLFRSQDEAEKARERAESVSAPIPLFMRLSFDGRLWEAEKQGDQVVLRPEVGAALTLSTIHLQQLLDTGAATLVGEDAPSQLSEEARTVAWRWSYCFSGGQPTPQRHPGISARRERFGDKAHRAKLAAQLSGSRACLRLWVSRIAGQVGTTWQSSVSRRRSLETASRNVSSYALRNTPGETSLRRLCPLP